MSGQEYRVPKIYTLLKAKASDTKKTEIHPKDNILNEKLEIENNSKILAFGAETEEWAVKLAEENKVAYAGDGNGLKKHGIKAIDAGIIAIPLRNRADWLFAFEPDTPLMPIIALKALAGTIHGIKLLFLHEEKELEIALKEIAEKYSAGYAKKRLLVKAIERKELLVKPRSCTLYTLETNIDAKENASTDLMIIEAMQKKTGELYEDALFAEKLGFAEAKEFAKKIGISHGRLIDALKRINALAGLIEGKNHGVLTYEPDK